MSPKLSPPKIGDVLARQGEDIDTRYHPSAAENISEIGRAHV